MEKLVCEAYENIIRECPDQDLDVENIYGILRKYIPDVARQCGLTYCKAVISEPGRGGRFAPPIVKERIFMEAPDDGRSADIREFKFEMGNGGTCVIMFGIPAGSEWTGELESNAYLLAKTSFLLAGRTRIMSDLQRMTYTDQLTGIANKTKLIRFIIDLIVEGKFYGYCANFVNIKNMKLLNNRYSDRVGDAIIVKYANEINDFLGPDNCIARMGGDNFSVYISADREEEFLNFMRDLKVVPEIPGSDSKIEVKVDSRIGYYFIQPGDIFDVAMESCSIAFSYAKFDQNPDFMKYEDSMKSQIIKLKELEENIPRAIEDEEFVLYYQPKADISDPDRYKVCGAEALVRWQHAGEMVQPGDFIPIIEKNGMVTMVDFYVFEHVCRDIQKWVGMGLKPVRVSSNFSRRHLKDSAFADKIEAIIDKYKIDPSYLEIEITESYDMEDLEALTKFEQRMHKLGINLSVDDFGSGFSSLKFIKDIAADVIKLDKSLIDGVGVNENDDILVSHLIQMIKSLGKNVIAEGVEQKDQADFLRDNGCSFIQGFVYARPMPETQFETYLDKN